MDCGCYRGVHLRPSRKDLLSLTLPSDIVIEIAHETSLNERSLRTDGFNLLEERERTLQIVELFARWLPDRDTIVSHSPNPGFE